MRTSPDLIDLARVRATLDQGGRAALFIRHSERFAISPDDKEFGYHVELTPHGVELARAAGRRLNGLGDARFFASPMVRTRSTARHIAEGMGLPAAEVEDADPLGVRGYYYEDPYAVQDLMRQQGYMPFMLEYLRTGAAPHSHPLDPATEKTAAWLRSQTTTRLGVYVSHDIFIAAFLTSLKLRTYTAENWVGYLHGAALLCDGRSDWTCHPCVPDLEALRTPSPFVH